MIPVDQTTFGAPGGNCLSACVASILDLPIEEVPYFMSDRFNPQGVDWVRKLNSWLRPRGYRCHVFVRDIMIPEYHIAHGVSPRGVGTHAVVARGNRMVHDPHPSRQGIVGLPTARTVIAGFIR